METKIANLRFAIINLDKSLHDPFEASFRGSKAQRKNAEKRLANMRNELNSLKGEFVLSLKKELANVEEDIASTKRFLDETLRTDWWEEFSIETIGDEVSHLRRMELEKNDLVLKIALWSK